MNRKIVFWQRMISPHMTELAREVAQLGHDVHYVYEQPISNARLEMGWRVEPVPSVHLHEARTDEDARDLVATLPQDSIHLTQGVRSNGIVGTAQNCIIQMKKRHYPMIEKVDLRGWRGLLKPAIYRRRFLEMAGSSEAILAIGEGCDQWIRRLAPATLRVHPFAYFLRGPLEPTCRNQAGKRFIFVGSLIRLKRIDLLVEALKGLDYKDFELNIVGEGPERRRLERLSAPLAGRVIFHGTLPASDALSCIADADCLILPSEQDGWGAVISEALINGTPVICSTECGASGVVRRSKNGGVFQSGNVDALKELLSAQIGQNYTHADRQMLRGWATCLTATVGANYLLALLAARDNGQTEPVPPWETPERMLA